MATRTRTKAATKPEKKLLSFDEAVQRVMERPAVDMATVATVMGVHVSTAQRQAANGAFPFPFARIGQRWIIPSEAVRAFLATKKPGDIREGAA